MLQSCVDLLRRSDAKVQWSNSTETIAANMASAAKSPVKLPAGKWTTQESYYNGRIVCVSVCLSVTLPLAPSLLHGRGP